MPRFLEVPGKKVPPARYNFLAYGAYAAVLCVLWPTIRAAVYLHDLVGVLALEYFRFDEGTGHEFFAAYRAASYTYTSFSDLSCAVGYIARGGTFPAYCVGPVYEGPEGPEKKSAYRGEYGCKDEVIHRQSIARR